MSKGTFTYGGGKGDKAWEDTYSIDPKKPKEILTKLNIVMYKCMFPNAIYFEDLNEITEVASEILGYIHYYDVYQNPKTSHAQKLHKDFALFVDMKSAARTTEEKNNLIKKIDETMDQMDDLVMELIKNDTKFHSTSPVDQVLYSERERHLEFRQSLQKIPTVLLEEPILTESGRFEDKPLAPRTIADVEKEVAKFLSSPQKLPNLTAYIKTSTGEQKVTITRSNTGMSRTAFNERIASILRNNQRVGYIRPVHEVTAEIAARQTFYPAPQPIYHSVYDLSVPQPVYDLSVPQPVYDPVIDLSAPQPVYDPVIDLSAPIAYEDTIDGVVQVQSIEPIEYSHDEAIEAVPQEQSKKTTPAPPPLPPPLPQPRTRRKHPLP